MTLKEAVAKADRLLAAAKVFEDTVGKENDFKLTFTPNVQTFYPWTVTNGDAEPDKNGRYEGEFLLASPGIRGAVTQALFNGRNKMGLVPGGHSDIDGGEPEEFVFFVME